MIRASRGVGLREPSGIDVFRRCAVAGAMVGEAVTLRP